VRRLPAALLVLLLAGALLSGTPLTGVDPGPAVADPVIRIPGTDPIALPVAVSNAVVADHSTDTVLLGDVNDVTHALGAAAATGQLPTPAPLLFTPATALDPAVSSEIDRVLPSPATASSKVYLLGPGFTAGGPVETALTTRGVTVDHVSGATPADTAALLANRLLPTGGVDRTVLLVPPTDPLAAAAAGAWGANRALPVLLAGTSDVLPPATLRYITETAATTVVLIGSRTAIGLGQQHSLEDRGVTVRRASGTDSENLATQVAQSWANPTLVTGTALAPVLVGPAGPASAALASPLLSAAKAAVGIRAPLLIVPTTGTADPRSDCDRSDGRGTPCYLLGAAPGPMTVVGDASLVSDAGVATLDAARSSGRDTYVPNFSHVFVVVFENKNYNDIFGPGGRANAPYLNSLLASGAQSTQFYGVTHNSQPNYLALVGGITPTATTQQDCPQYNCIYGPEVRHIGDQLEAAGRTWKGYMDGMKSPCQRPAPEGAGDQYFLQGVPPGNTYATRHNPWMYLRNVVGDQARCNLHDVPYPQLVTDVATGHVPDFSLIVPDLCHDGHDSDQQCTALSGSRGGIAGIDSWAAQELPRILTSPTYQDGGLLVVTFDESENDNTGCCLTPAAPGGGRVGTIVLSPSWGREAGFEDPTPYNQYNLLHTIETGWGLGPVGVSGDSRAYQMSLLFRRPAAAGGSGPVNPPGGGGTPGGTGSPPATPSQWLFAEGTTRPGFTEYLSLANPSVTTNTATITYFTTAAGTGAVNPAKTSTHVLAPQSRTTVAVNDAGEAGPDVDVSTLVTVAGPGSETVVAERPLYFHGVFAFAATDGSDVVGARAPAREWWFAEGTTRPGFQEYLTLENPGPATNAHIEFTTRDPATGASTVITRPAVPLPAESRTTIDVNRSDQAGPAVTRVDTSTARSSSSGPNTSRPPSVWPARSTGATTWSARWLRRSRGRLPKGPPGPVSRST
jgi:hypothetical protein